MRAIEIGFQQREIHESAYRWQKRVESGDAVVVGVNRFVEERAGPTAELLRVDETLQREAGRAAADAARRGATTPAVKKALAAVEEAARGDANLMPLILDAVERYATLGEISDALRNVFGVYQDQFTF